MKQIQLNRGYVALVDDEDYGKVSPFRWSVHFRRSKNFTRIYAKHTFRINGKRKTIFMHVFLLSIVTGIDHADNNGLNNQRINIRPADQSQNTANARKTPGTASPFRGVSRAGDCNRWRAKINKDGVKYELGLFKDEADAATAYNFKAFELFGEFAKFNTPIVHSA